LPVGVCGLDEGECVSATTCVTRNMSCHCFLQSMMNKVIFWQWCPGVIVACNPFTRSTPSSFSCCALVPRKDFQEAKMFVVSEWRLVVAGATPETG